MVTEKQESKFQFADNGRGEMARLFPVLSENSKEGRAASILLSTIQLVPKFADNLFRPIGRGIGVRSRIECRSEVVFKSNPKLRPDGLITITSGGKDWSSLVEFKVGGSLEAVQIENYLKLARENGVDALITVSNDIVQDPTISPVKVDGRLMRGASLYHFSWMHIFTIAELTISRLEVDDAEQKAILKEFARFLVHRSTGIRGYEAMPAEWPSLVQRVRNKERVGKRDPELLACIDGWMQEERELSFIMSRLTASNCTLKTNRGQSADRAAREGFHINGVTEKSTMVTAIAIPSACSTLNIELDLMSQSIALSMIVHAPKDRKRSSASVNWLLRNLMKRPHLTQKFVQTGRAGLPKRFQV